MYTHTHTLTHTVMCVVPEKTNEYGYVLTYIYSIYIQCSLSLYNNSIWFGYDFNLFSVTTSYLRPVSKYSFQS